MMPERKGAAIVGRTLILTLALLLLIDKYADSACNPGWTAFEDNCYTPAAGKMDIRMARQACQDLGADIAHAEIFQIAFFQSVLNIEEQEEYWIREESTNTSDVIVPDGCPYYYASAYNNASTSVNGTSTGIFYGLCDAQKRFICEAPQFNSEFYCPQDWFMAGSTCYKIMKHPATYNNSASFCSALRAQLAVLDNVDKERNALAAITGHYDDVFMVGATRDNGVLKWSNSMPFHPNCEECADIRNEEDCLGIQSSATHLATFEWKSLNCSDSNDFLCEMSPLRSTTTTTKDVPEISTTTSESTTESTTIPPLTCPAGYNWKPHFSSGFCFWETTYETDKLNWYQARAFCQSYGGDLATYRDRYQEEHGLGSAKGHYRGMWFGLQRGQDDTFSWVDGSPLNYTNWNYMEPKLQSTSNYCVMHGASDSRWELDYCGVRRWFVCKAPRVTKQVLPNTNLFQKTVCNDSGSYFYREYLYKDHCYTVRESESYSWDMALNYCQDNGAQLASVHSFEETNFILTLISTSATGDLWIGLSAKGLHSQYTWMDNSPLEFVYWNEEKNRDSIYVNSCIKFNSQRGFWTVDHCNRFAGIICKRGVNASSDSVLSTPSPVLPGNCETGWYPFGNQCYKIYGETIAEKQNWTTALKNCRDLGSDLTSIHGKEESEFLADLLLTVGADAWIGLNVEIQRGKLYIWKDNTSLDYTNWVSDSPTDNPLKSCVALTYATYSMGRWSQTFCSKLKSYICRKPKNPSLTKPSEDLFSCSHIPGWSKLGSSCFGFFSDKLTWLEAQSKCREYDANLLQFDNSATGLFLKKRIANETELLWTGIRETEKNKYGLMAGRRMKYSNWLRLQPKKASAFMDNCVVMNYETKWIVKGCQERHPFVCEWSSSPMEDVVEDNYVCPNTSSTWEDLGGNSCYFFDTFIKRSWDSAMLYCLRHGGFLASFHSKEELDQVRRHLINEYTYIHIGLAKRKDGSFAWVDNTPVDFVQWDPEIPLVSSYSSKDCVQMSVETGYWRLIDCDDYIAPFICYTPKVKNSFGGALALNSTKKVDVVSSKLEVGGIFGIIICLLVVAAIIGVTVYYLCPPTRRNIRIRFLDST